MGSFWKVRLISFPNNTTVIGYYDNFETAHWDCFERDDSKDITKQQWRHRKWKEQDGNTPSFKWYRDEDDVCCELLIQEIKVGTMESLREYYSSRFHPYAEGVEVR